MTIPALVIVHWPGKDIPACLDHATKLKAVANTLGFFVSMTPSSGDEMCTNCENEAKKEGVA